MPSVTESAPDPRQATDTMGKVEIEPGALWGAQTQRAMAHFPLRDEPMPVELIRALACIKGACATVNGQLGLLEPVLAQAICAAAQEVFEGQHDGQFPLSVWQSGSGTQSHMNVNEVLAELARQRLGGQRPVHPNDDVNLGQSSNDLVPSAMHLAALLVWRDQLRPCLRALMDTLASRAALYPGLIKLGRTHLQDAVPLTVAQEINAWRHQLHLACRSIEDSLSAVQELAVGGTAVGTGLNTHPQFGHQVCRELEARTGLPCRPAANRFAAMAGHEPLVALHGALKVLAVALVKMANDVRLLASGPRGGCAELMLPANEPGSSIMPGKVNPTQCEALVMMAYQVIGNDVAVTLGATGGHLQLNTHKPLIAANVLRSMRLLAAGMASFDRHCARGLTADPVRIGTTLSQSLMLVTALVPHIGYDRAAQIAHHAHSQGCSLRDAALAAGVAAANFDEWADPAAMVPGR